MREYLIPGLLLLGGFVTACTSPTDVAANGRAVVYCQLLQFLWKLETQLFPLLLGKEVLDDYFLAKLVLRAILDVGKEKLRTYKASSASLLDCKGDEQIDIAYLGLYR